MAVTDGRNQQAFKESSSKGDQTESADAELIDISSPSAAEPATGEASNTTSLPATEPTTGKAADNTTSPPGRSATVMLPNLAPATSSKNPWKTVTTVDVGSGPTSKKVHIIEFEGSIVAIPENLLALITSTRGRGSTLPAN